MKLKNWKEFFKNKASAGLVITGIMAVAVVTAITLNQGSKTEEGPLIDWDAEGGKDQVKDNDSLLEYDDYAGNLPSAGEDMIHNQVDIIGSGALDLAQENGGTTKPGKEEVTPKPEQTDGKAADNTAQTNDNSNSVANSGSSTGIQTADAGNTTQPGTDQKTDSGKNVADSSSEVKTDPAGADKVQEVSGITVESLSFHLEDGLSWPVHGAVLLPFSADHAVYHPTLNQFKINPALLIGCDPGTEVLAPVRGIITEIVETPMTGWTVTMAVGDDYTLVYGQLEKGKLAVGDVLEAGDTIGTVARVTKYYTMEGNHLYFQMKHGEEILDPTEFLKTE